MGFEKVMSLWFRIESKESFPFEKMNRTSQQKDLKRFSDLLLLLIFVCVFSFFVYVDYVISSMRVAKEELSYLLWKSKYQNDKEKFVLLKF